jgi:thiamine-monophosphate kinase
LRYLQGKVELPANARDTMVGRLELPSARLELGQALLSLANAAIDLSDGLIADLGHICGRSKLGATVRFSDVPLSPVLGAVEDQALQAACALAGGDDYELCFTAPGSARADVEAIGTRFGIRLSRIGHMHAGEGVLVQDAAGNVLKMQSSGFDHFGAHG